MDFLVTSHFLVVADLAVAGLVAGLAVAGLPCQNRVSSKASFLRHRG